MATSSAGPDSMRNNNLEVNEIIGLVSSPTSAVGNEAALLEPVKSRFYPGDVVVHKEDKKLAEWMLVFGTVLKPRPTKLTVMEMDSELDKSEDLGEENEFLVHWDYTNKIKLTKSSTVSLVDRVLLKGQRVGNSEGKVGTVIDYEVSASVLINGTNTVVKNVALSRLRPISPYFAGQQVLLKDWIGKITSIKRNVWFITNSGIVFYLETDDSGEFYRVDPYWGLGVACPGMRTKLTVGTLKKAKWVSGRMRFFKRWLPLSRIFSNRYSTILRTEVSQLEVQWLHVAPGVPEYIEPPNSIVTPSELSELTLIGTPSTETIGINSVRKLQILRSDALTKYNYWLQDFKHKFVDELNYMEFRKNKHGEDVDLRDLREAEWEYTETPVKVLLRHNVVTVKWEDGSEEKIPAIEIPKIYSPVCDLPKSNDKYHGKAVLLKALKNRTGGSLREDLSPSQTRVYPLQIVPVDENRN